MLWVSLLLALSVFFFIFIFHVNNFCLSHLFLLAPDNGNHNPVQPKYIASVYSFFNLNNDNSDFFEVSFSPRATPALAALESRISSRRRKNKST